MENLNINEHLSKVDGNVLAASEWNSLFGNIQDKTNEIVSKVNEIEDVNGFHMGNAGISYVAYCMANALNKMTKYIAEGSLLSLYRSGANWVPTNLSSANKDTLLEFDLITNEPRPQDYEFPAETDDPSNPGGEVYPGTPEDGGIEN